MILFQTYPSSSYDSSTDDVADIYNTAAKEEDNAKFKQYYYEMKHYDDSGYSSNEEDEKDNNEREDEKNNNEKRKDEMDNNERKYNETKDEMDNNEKRKVEKDEMIMYSTNATTTTTTTIDDDATPRKPDVLRKSIQTLSNSIQKLYTVVAKTLPKANDEKRFLQLGKDIVGPVFIPSMMVFVLMLSRSCPLGIKLYTFIMFILHIIYAVYRCLYCNASKLQLEEADKPTVAQTNIKSIDTAPHDRFNLAITADSING